MTRKKDTFSFIDQPRWHEGSIHNEFAQGKKADYAIQLIPTEALPEAREHFHPANTVAVVHMPLGVIGAAPFRALERDTIEDTRNPVVGVELWTGGKHAGHFIIMQDGGRFTSVRRRRSKPLRIKVRGPIAREAYELADRLLERHAAGDLAHHSDPIEVPTRAGRMWMWSARWRELYADPEQKVRPVWLGEDGQCHYLGSSGSTDISFKGVVSK